MSEGGKGSQDLGEGEDFSSGGYVNNQLGHLANLSHESIRRLN